jgi:predicted nuclease of predicted toxin-antitoxin system
LLEPLMRIVADSNIQKSTVVALRGDGHDVVWVMERVKDPGDRAILEEAVRTKRVVITADKGFGQLVFREKRPHAGVMLLDETPTVGAQSRNVLRCIGRFGAELEEGAFLRVAADGRVRRRSKAS